MAGVTFIRGKKADLAQRPIVNGQILFETDQEENNRVLMDIKNENNEDERIFFGGAIPDWIGTLAQYTALPQTKLTDGKSYYITDYPSDNSSVINDNTTSSTTKTWSANKINTEVTAINSNLDKIGGVWVKNGLYLNGADGDSVLGSGTATITYCGSKTYRIDLNMQITQATTLTSANYTYGINRDYFTSIVGQTIKPITGGSLMYYRNNQIYADVIGMGGIAEARNQFWTPARVYTEAGAIGGWDSRMWLVGDRIAGTIYGVVD